MKKPIFNNIKEEELNSIISRLEALLSDLKIDILNSDDRAVEIQATLEFEQINNAIGSISRAIKI